MKQIIEDLEKITYKELKVAFIGKDKWRTIEGIPTI